MLGRQTMDALAFERLAREVMSKHFSTKLEKKGITGIPKEFDCVSADDKIVGDAKYLTLVGGKKVPPAKFSMIAEHVWLLEKVNAQVKFLAFGNDKRVPEWWLKKFDI